MREPKVTMPKPERRSVLGWLKARLLPEVPDFYALLVEHCAVTAEGAARLEALMRDCDPSQGAEVRRLEHEGDRIKARNLEILHRSFATPMDREDIYIATMAIDEVLNYAKACVRELEMLEISPDRRMAEMAGLLTVGARALEEGFRALRQHPAAADGEGERARKSEREMEKLYRSALAELFDPVQQQERLKNLSAAGDSSAEIDRRSFETLVIVTDMMKRREIYRHLSNAADQIAHAAQVLEDIVAKET